MSDKNNEICEEPWVLVDEFEKECSDEEDREIELPREPPWDYNPGTMVRCIESRVFKSTTGVQPSGCFKGAICFIEDFDKEDFILQRKGFLKDLYIRVNRSELDKYFKVISTTNVVASAKVDFNDDELNQPGEIKPLDAPRSHVDAERVHFLHKEVKRIIMGHCSPEKHWVQDVLKMIDEAGGKVKGMVK